MKRSKHSLSHYNLMTANMGQLVPCGRVEVLPGDSMQHRVSSLIRMAPQAAPVMHPITARFHTFNVPTRIIWGTEFGDSGSFESFITGGKNNDDVQEVPKITVDFPAYVGTTHVGSLLDLLDVPEANGLEVSAIPFRAFWLTYEEYYADQDLVEVPDWRDPVVLAQLVHEPPPQVAWSKDYFTTARPWAQKGAAITLPVVGQAPIKGMAVNSLSTYPNAPTTARESDGSTVSYSSSVGSHNSQPDNFFLEEDPNNPGYPNVYADLSQAQQVSINAFREAFALQRYSEARARYGSRYTEYLQYLGIRPSDARLQRPEYLGGSKQTVQISEVLQQTQNITGEEGNGFGVGDLYGHGLAALRSKRWKRFFEEHGTVLTLMSVIPMPMYQNGVPRDLLRTSKEDFFQKELAQIGQQELFNAEVFADGTGEDLETFGFQDRYSEYKHKQSRIHGEFRTTLNYWHMAQDYAARPALNQTFIECVPTDRTFNVETGSKLWCMVNHSIQARRLVPKSSASRIL